MNRLEFTAGFIERQSLLYVFAMEKIFSVFKLLDRGKNFSVIFCKVSIFSIDHYVTHRDVQHQN